MKFRCGNLRCNQQLNTAFEIFRYILTPGFAKPGFVHRKAILKVAQVCAYFDPRRIDNRHGISITRMRGVRSPKEKPTALTDRFISLTIAGVILNLWRASAQLS